MKNYTALSTKKLTPEQQALLFGAGIHLTHYDAITIEKVEFKFETPIKNAIITSRHAARMIIDKKIHIENCYCVGEKTKAVLTQNNLKVSETGRNSKDLAQKIIENHKNETFTFFCGDKRRDELPALLNTQNITLKEINIYKTRLNPGTIKNNADAILFFSPSAVEAFILKNAIGNSTVFCIGPTTASEARKYTKNICIAGHPTIEDVLTQVINHKNKHD